MLVYACVARASDAVVLAQHAAVGFLGNLEAVAMESFTTFRGSDTRFSIMCDGWVFNFVVAGGFVVVVVADEGFGRELPFATAKRISDEFLARFAARGRTARHHGMQRAFRCVLRRPAAGRWARRRTVLGAPCLDAASGLSAPDCPPLTPLPPSLPVPPLQTQTGTAAGDRLLPHAPG